MTAQRGSALPYFRTILEGPIDTMATEVSALVVISELAIGVMLLVGRPLRPAIWAGVALNIAFVMAGRVNTLWLMAAATQVPFIRTIEPAAVIEDPAMMLTFATRAIPL